MTEVLQQEQSALAANENIRLGGWLERLTTARQALQNFVGNEDFAHFNGMMQWFNIPDELDITITPAEGSTLEEVGYRGIGPMLTTGREYTADEPFTGGGAIKAELYETGASEKDRYYGDIAVKLYGVERGTCPQAAIVTNELLPQVAIAIVDGEAQPIE